MSEIIVTQTSVLYRPSDKTIIAEVFVGESYSIPIGIEVYIGTLEDFLNDNPDYNN